MNIVGVLCFSDEILADVTELRLALERKGYTVHLQQIGYGLHSMESGYYEEGSLVLWLGRCFGDVGRSREIVEKYLQAEVDVILAMQAPALRVALEASEESSIPVVFSHIIDTQAEGLTELITGACIKVTGLCDAYLEASAERLGLLAQVVPAPTSVHALVDKTLPTATAETDFLISTAEKLGFQMVIHQVSDLEEARQELVSLQTRGDHALFRTFDSSLASLSALMGAVAHERYIPYVGIGIDEMERCNALFALDQRGVGNQTANLICRILAGETPGDIPFAGPDKQILGVNLQVSLDLGLTVSQMALERAQVVVPERQRTSLGGRLLLVLVLSSLVVGLIGGSAATIRTVPWLLAALSAASLVVLLLWLYLQRRVIRPVKYLTLAAEKIGAGNLDMEIGEIKIEDEIGVLSRAFRRMRSNIKHSQVELQKLTASLQQQIQERAEAYHALQQAQQELEITSRQIVEADDSSRFALTTYIHDEVLTLLDELVNRASKSGDPSLADLATEMEQHIRRVRFGLSVPVIQDLDIELHRLLQEILPQFYPEAQRVRLDLDLACLKSLDNLEPACTVLFYRFASGAVSNAYRHAHAQKVSVEATQSESQLFLRVSDDGVGFDPVRIEGLVSDGHYFFHDITARARQLGGSLNVESAPGSGTRLEVYVPIKRVMRTGKPGGRGSKRKQP